MAQATLIDTDIGDDVDDAFALALATQLSELHLCGVTTVGGPVERRAALARLLLDTAHYSNVPVVAGSSAMSDGNPGSAKFSHAPVLARAEDRIVAPRAISPTAAVDFILACSHNHRPLTIIALGPLTNIAAALRADPGLPKRVRLVAMAGKLGWPYPDWNLRCDPAAARAVLSSGLAVTLVGMHVTMRCKLQPAQIRHLYAAQGSLGQLLARCVLAWRTWQRRMPILHDALTVAVAADPTLVRLEARRMQVGWAGFSVADRREPLNTLVCTTVDIRRFQALFINSELFR